MAFLLSSLPLPSVFLSVHSPNSNLLKYHISLSLQPQANNLKVAKLCPLSGLSPLMSPPSALATGLLSLHKNHGTFCMARRVLYEREDIGTMTSKGRRSPKIKSKGQVHLDKKEFIKGTFRQSLSWAPQDKISTTLLPVRPALIDREPGSIGWGTPGEECLRINVP